MAIRTEGTPEWAIRALSEVFDPCCREKGISVVDMGLLRSIVVDDRHARVELLLTSGWCPFAARSASCPTRSSSATGSPTSQPAPLEDSHDR
jgi:metal-sulfur cluster biosynthetic enzyme